MRRKMFACQDGGCQSEIALHTFWAYKQVGKQGKNGIEDEIDDMQKGIGARQGTIVPGTWILGWVYNHKQ